MATELVTVEVWVMIDEDGDYAVGKEREDAVESYENDVREVKEAVTRFVKVTLQVPKPAPVELSATIAEESAAGELKVA